MVKYLAARKISVSRSTCDFDDLVSCGLIALLRAVESFDPAKGASFDGYAWTRVSGAVIDELRRMDRAPRSLRNQQRRIASAREAVQRRAGRSPTNREIANEIGVPVAELVRRLHALDVLEVISLHTPVRDTGGHGSCMVEIGSTLPALGAASDDPEMATITAERTRVIRDAIRLLSEQEQTALSLVYAEGLTGAEAAHVLGVTESRVSQILSGIRRKLKRHMARYDSLDSSSIAA
jgi:RNA polymerase sigma factor for flagellar operon FliA